jgi:hypothetical protein
MVGGESGSWERIDIKRSERVGDAEEEGDGGREEDQVGGGKERGRRKDGVELKELGVSIITVPSVFS